MSQCPGDIALQFHHLLLAGKDVPCIESFKVLINVNEGVVLQIPLREFLFLLLQFSIPTVVNSHSYLWEILSCQHSPFLGYEALERLVFLGVVLHPYWSCLCST